MHHSSAKFIATASLLVAGLALPLPTQATSIVLPGWDLLATQPGTTFGGAGRTYGVRPVHDAVAAIA